MNGTEVDSDLFFSQLIAAIVVNGRQNELKDRVALNRAFWKAINSPHGAFINKTVLGIDYDPLFAMSPWFERALTQAQRDRLISFPNPSYETVSIRLDPAEAQELLSESSQPEDVKALAAAFIEILVSEK